MSRMTREEYAKLDENIRQDLRNRLRPYEIADHLSLGKSTIYRRLEVIRQQDQKWIEQMALEQFTSAYRTAMESLENQIRQLIVIREVAQDPDSKIRATLAIRDIEMDIIELLAQGPTVYALRRKAQRTGQPISSEQASQTA